MFSMFIDFNPENAKDCNQETLFGQHLLVCALQEMACLVLSLGTTASNLLTSCSKYLHPIPPALIYVQAALTDHIKLGILP